MNSSNRTQNGSVIWFTGLSGAGKTTLAERLYAELKSKGRNVEYLDGDRVRAAIGNSGFSREERLRHLKIMGWTASLLESHGVTVIASFITPYEMARREIRSLCRNFIEVYVSTPIEVCEKRDPKGLYKKARAGELKSFTGVDDEFEIPANPEITIDTSTKSADSAFMLLKSDLTRLGAF